MGNTLYILPGLGKAEHTGPQKFERVNSKSQIINARSNQSLQQKCNSAVSKFHKSSVEVNKIFQPNLRLDFFTKYIKDIFGKPVKPRMLKKSFSCNEKTASIKFDKISCKLVRNKSTFNLKEFNYLQSQENSGTYQYELKSVEKSNKLRKSYITKLLVKNVWQPTVKKSQIETLFIYDWDDTFFCTSYFSPSGLFNSKKISINSKDKSILNKLEDYVFQILTLSLQKGQVYIVTNAAPGWVEFSVLTYYKKLYPLLSKIKIISARGMFEKSYPDDSKRWKIETFLEIRKNLDLGKITNFICMGDSQIEIDASNIFVEKFHEIYLKTIKFREHPTPQDLLKQLKLVNEQFNHIYSSPKNLIIKVERKERNDVI